MKRKIKGHIKRLDGSPWQGVSVRFRLLNGSYVKGVNYPADEQLVKTDTSGFFGIDLWCSESGIVESVYECWINQEYFNFSVPSGNSDLELTSLIQRGVVNNNPDTPIDPIPVEEIEETITQFFIPSQGQTSFVLTEAPIKPQLTQLFLNGVKAIYVREYVLDSDRLIWNSVVLDPEDTLEVTYSLPG